MVFVRGDVPSVLAVQHALASFASISGLHANVDKTQIYFGGVVQEVRAAILTSTGFSEGSFPFHYLGLPLGPSRYSVSMFDSLILKIQTKLQHWSAKSLTYAGKAQLLDAVIFGIENFWCSSVLLPKNVLHQIWKFSNGSNSLWVNWHKKYVLKTYTIWSLTSKDQFSSSFKGILAARDVFLTKTGSPQAAEGFIVPSHRVAALLAAQRKLAIVDNLQHRGFQLVSRCSLCKQDLDTHQHLFFSCPFSKAVWTALVQWQHLTLSHLDLLDLMQWSYGSQNGWVAAWFRTTLAAATYGIWMERNRCIFMNQEGIVQTVVNRVKYNVAVHLYMNPRFSKFVSQLSD
ncbi:uncharacterized protein LOC141657334 [Silene latifolia]|uniref:uncharacterized protein LOC141657334 n=1 Tax=Silene latifolia TaxID=37657 RepID=UPI003D7819D1